MLSSKKIVLLGREDRPTAILYNSLRSEFPLAGVIVEEGESRLKFVNRRVKRLGLRKTLGQVAFRLFVVPWLKATSRRRIEEIIQQFGLDASPMPAIELVRVRSVNSDDTVQFLQELQPGCGRGERHAHYWSARAELRSRQCSSICTPVLLLCTGEFTADIGH